MRKVALRLNFLVAASCCLSVVDANVPPIPVPEVPINEPTVARRPFSVVRPDDSSYATSSSIASLVAVFQLGDTSRHDSLSWLVGDNATVFSAILSDDNGNAVFRMPRLPSDGKLMTSLGLVSDVIVVALPSKIRSLEEVVETLQGIVRDAEARTVSDAEPKYRRRLVLVSNAATDPLWVEEITQTHHLQQLISPLFWDTFEIMTPENFRIQWNARNLVGETQILKELLPYDNNVAAVSPLLQTVYQSICGNKKIEQDVAIAESFFELEAIAAPHVTSLASSDKTENLTDSKPILSTDKDKEDPQDLVQLVLSVAQTKLYDLESDMQEVVLESQSLNRMPMLDFGDKVNIILQEAYDKLSGFPTAALHGLLSRLVTKAHQLYMDQLQGLRDYYGRRYEACLDHETDKAAWTAEAEHLTQGFRAAATNAVPSLCRPDGVLAKVLTFDSTSVLKGLVQDMIDATELRMDERSPAFDEDNGEDESLERRRFPPWVKKVASRVLALGINYLQGWLAWQGVKRAALERDREMPKFPLF